VISVFLLFLFLIVNELPFVLCLKVDAVPEEEPLEAASIDPQDEGKGRRLPVDWLGIGP